MWDELSSEEAVAVVADHVQSAGGPHRATPRDLEGAAEKIKEAVANAKKVVIVGGSFIGSEAAASLKGKFGDAVSIEIVNSGLTCSINISARRLVR